MTDIDYAARVTAGVALLDEKRPGWERELNLDTLDIRNGGCCVTAQLSGCQSYLNGARQLNLVLGDDGTYVACGFNVESHYYNETGEELPEDYDQDEAYDVLNQIWRGVITERLAAGSEGSA